MDMQQLNKTLGHALGNYQLAKAQGQRQSVIDAFRFTIKMLNRAKSSLKSGHTGWATFHVNLAVHSLKYL
jgi:hypothetical protein